MSMRKTIAFWLIIATVLTAGCVQQPPAGGASAAGTGNITGSVTWATAGKPVYFPVFFSVMDNRGKPIDGARFEITVRGKAYAQTTDSNGQFVWQPPLPVNLGEEFLLKTSVPSYKEYEANVTIKDESNHYISMRLQKQLQLTPDVKETYIPTQTFFNFEEQTFNTNMDIILSGFTINDYFTGGLSGLFIKMNGNWTGMNCPTEGYAELTEKSNATKPERGDRFCIKTEEGNYVKALVAGTSYSSPSFMVLDWVISSNGVMPVDTLPPAIVNVTFGQTVDGWSYELSKPVPSKPVTIYFSEPIDLFLTWNTYPSVILYKDGNAMDSKTIQLTKFGSVASINPLQLQPGNYELEVKGKIKDLSGNMADIQWRGKFTFP